MLFHRINYLDLRKIEYYIDDYWDLNPYFFPEHLYILSSLYLIEVGYSQSEYGLKICKEKDKWVEYPLFKREISYPNYDNLCYTYNIDDFISSKSYNKKKKICLKNDKYEIKILKKEDFPDVLLFLQKYYSSIGKLNQESYFKMLSILKFSFDHLYELNLRVLSIWNDANMLGFYLGFHRKGYFVLEALLPLKEVDAYLLDMALIEANKNKERLVLFKNIDEIIDL